MDYGQVIIYLSVPGLIWDAILKMAKSELEIIPDADICMFFERGIKGATSYLFNRYNKANNKYLKS